MKSIAFSSRLSLLALLVTAFILTGCGLSLAEDITPPPNYRPPTRDASAGQGQAVNVSIPSGPADLDAGKAVYTEKCLPCHGETGMGDGPDAAALPNPVAKLGDPALAQASRPADWYQIVTTGNIEKFMPGFKSLDDAARWNVVGYAFSLSKDSAVLEQAGALYAENCAACHGNNGKGDGPDGSALTPAPGDWTDPTRLSGLSEVEMAELIAQGKGSMPAFGDRLDEDQRLLLAAYARHLSLTASGQSAETAQGEATPDPAQTLQPGETPSATEQAAAALGTGTPAARETITITGKVVSASPNGTVPADLPVSLVGFAGMAPAFSLEGKAGPDGSFRFENVEFSPEYVYLASAQSDGVNFNSEIVHGRDIATDTIDLPIEVYATTADTSALKADRMHVFFDFSTPGAIQVIELFIISNPSEQVVIAKGDGEAVLNFDLPEGATNLQFEDSKLGDRYVETATGFGDRASINPGMGQHQVLFAYELPYDRKLDINLSAPIPVDAAVIMLPQAGIRLKSDQLVDAGERDVQGMTYRMYNASSAVQPGQPIKMQLSGRAGAGADGGGDPLIPILIAGSVFALALAGAIYWFIRQRRALQPAYAVVEPEEEAGVELETSDSLLEAIVTLDDLHQAGKLPDPAYQERRTELKARLSDVLKREKSA